MTDYKKKTVNKNFINMYLKLYLIKNCIVV